MSSSESSVAIHQNQGCCFIIKHSETCRQIKEGTLLAVGTIALAAIGFFVLVALAHNGVNLGGFNAISTMIAEKWTYLALICAGSVLVLDITLIAALMRSYYDKQLTQQEINQLNLGEWVEANDIAAKLEPGQYWRLPPEYDQPIRGGSESRPAIFGAIVKNHAGTLGVYAFHAEEDCVALLGQLNYRNGESLFANSPIYTERFIIDTKASDDQKNEIQAFRNWKMKEREYLELSLDIEIDGVNQRVHALRVNGKKTISFFKNTAEGLRKLQETKAGHLNRSEIEENIEQQLDEVAYLPENSFWEIENPVVMTPFNGTQEEAQELFVVFVRANGAAESTYNYFFTHEDRDFFVDGLIDQDENIVDAKEKWNDPIYYPNPYVEENYDLSSLNGISLAAQQFAIEYLPTQTTEGEEEGTLVESSRIYALRFLDTSSVFKNLYFRTEEQRTRYISESLHDYTDIEAIREAVEIIKEENYLSSILVTPNQDCWIDEYESFGKTYYLVLGFNGVSINEEIFFSSELRDQFLLSNNWRPVNAETNPMYTERGEFAEAWIHEHTQESERNLIENVTLQNGEFVRGVLLSTEGKAIYWITSRDTDVDGNTTFYFGVEAGRSDYEGELHEHTDLVQERAVEIKESKIRRQSLIPQINDCWSEENVDVSGISINILYTLTTEGIKISYPVDLQSAKRDLRDMNAIYQAAVQLQTTKLLDVALEREGHCWGDEEVEVAGSRVNILYKKTADGIEISFPSDLNRAKEGLTDIKQRIFEQGEYPRALGERFYPCTERERGFENSILNNEFSPWVGRDVENSAYPSGCHLVQIRSEEGELSYRYFTSREAYQNLTQGMVNAYVRTQKAVTILSEKILSKALTNIGDFWPEENVEINNGLCVNIIYRCADVSTETNGVITPSYVEDIQEALSCYKMEQNIKKKIFEKNEFPQTLGEYFCSRTEAQTQFEHKLIENEYCPWPVQQTNNLHFPPHCYPVQIKTQEGVSYRYFTTEEALSNAVQGMEYSIVKKTEKAEEILIQKHLKIALENVNDWWVEENVPLEQTSFNIFYRRTHNGENGIQYTFENDLNAATRNYDPDQNIKAMIFIKGIYPRALGELLSPISGIRNREEKILKNEHRIYNPTQTNNVFFPEKCIPLQYRNNHGVLTYHFFATAVARDLFISQKQSRNSYSREKITQEILDAKHLKQVLTQVNDWWIEEDVPVEKIHHTRILYIRTGIDENDIAVSFDTFAEPLEGRNIHAKVIDGEYPAEWGDLLMPTTNLEQDNEGHLLPGEYCLWTKNSYKYCFLLQVKESNGTVTYRRFETAQARINKIHALNLTNGVAREFNEINKARRMSITVNERVTPNSPKRFCTWHTHQGKPAHFTIVEVDGVAAHSEYVDENMAQARFTEIGLESPQDLYNTLPDIIGREKTYIDENEATWFLDTYLGTQRNGTGTLEVPDNQPGIFRMFEKNDFLGLLWVKVEGGTKTANWEYFKSEQALADYIQANLQGFVDSDNN